MIKLMRRWWRYLTAKLTGKFNETADPKVQLEQAIIEAQEQHRRLVEQAANVIANQKQTEMRLNRAMEDLEKVNNNARQAVLMADEAAKKGDAAKANEFTQTAEAFANRLIQLEKEVESLKTLHLQATQAADQAKHAVSQNSAAMQKKLAERQKLLGQLDQAKMQEQMNKAMASLSETVGEDVPTLDEVRQKIEARYAKAIGMSELQGASVESRMLEVEQAAMNSEAQTRLAEIRAQLGLAPAEVPAASTPAGAVTAGSAGGGTSASESRYSARTAHQIRCLGRGQDVRITRSSRWTTSCGEPSGSASVRLPATRASAADGIRVRPLANTRPSRPAISTASSTSN
jgi:phage shock protein A